MSENCTFFSTNGLLDLWLLKAARKSVKVKKAVFGPLHLATAGIEIARMQQVWSQVMTAAIEIERCPCIYVPLNCSFSQGLAFNSNSTPIQIRFSLQALRHPLHPPHLLLGPPDPGRGRPRPALGAAHQRGILLPRNVGRQGASGGAKDAPAALRIGAGEGSSQCDHQRVSIEIRWERLENPQITKCLNCTNVEKVVGTLQANDASPMDYGMRTVMSSVPIPHVCDYD